MIDKGLWVYYYIAGIFWLVLSLLICDVHVPDFVWCLGLLGVLFSAPLVFKHLDVDF